MKFTLKYSSDINHLKDVSVSYFLITLRKGGEPPRQFHHPAVNSATAFDQVAAEQGDDVFGITVVPA